MTRRRQSRRRHRSERRDRDSSTVAAKTPAPPASTPRAVPGPWFTEVSYTGLVGGVTGVLALGQSGVYLIAVNPDDVSPLRAIPVFAAAAVYLPAVWVSVRPTPNRRRVLRVVLAVTLVLMVLGAVLSDPAYFGLLLIPSSLLAIAAGMLFSRPSKETS